jgi:type 1 glutamine amidotransferase
VSPTEEDTLLTRGVEPFTIVDEEYQMVMAENETFVYLRSYSEEHGNTPQGWAHSYGKGKVAVLIPGHEKSVLSHPMVNRCIQNVLDWLSQD